MKLEMSGQMRLEQRMTLAPRMIQSMEILQLSILALQERIEQELSENPVLELTEPPAAEETQSESTAQDTAEANLTEKDLIIDTEHNNAADFERLGSIDNDFKDYMNQSGPFHFRTRSDDVDGKLQAIKNTAAPSQSLHEHLMDQWRLIDADEPEKKAGTAIIDYIDDRGYLLVRLEQLHNKDKADFSIENLKTALILVQRLEPAGVGARDLAECLLIQMAQSSEDMTFEARLVNEHMDTLLDNRLPEIARKMKCTIDRINDAVERLSKLDTSPGLLISQDRNQAVTADVIIERDDSGKFFARLAVSNLPTLRINKEYANMAKKNQGLPQEQYPICPVDYGRHRTAKKHAVKSHKSHPEIPDRLLRKRAASHETAANGKSRRLRRCAYRHRLACCCRQIRSV